MNDKSAIHTTVILVVVALFSVLLASYIGRTTGQVVSGQNVLMGKISDEANVLAARMSGLDARLVTLSAKLDNLSTDVSSNNQELNGRFSSVKALTEEDGLRTRAVVRNEGSNRDDSLCTLGALLVSVFVCWHIGKALSNFAWSVITKRAKSAAGKE